MKSEHLLLSIICILLLGIWVGSSNPAVYVVNDNLSTTSLSLPLEANGGVPVNIQDQTSRPIDIKMNQIINSNINLTTVPIVDTYSINVTSGHGLVAGDNFALLEQNGFPQIYFGHVISVNVNEITLDQPISYNFTPSATVAFEYDDAMNKDGSVTREVFGLTNFFDESVDITRFIIRMTDASGMDDSTFGGLPALTNGILVRKALTNGNFINIFQAHTNGDLGHLAFDKSYDDKVGGGLNGITVRMTYAGQSKHGVTIRLDPGESIQLLVQDDLTGLNQMEVMVQGHFVTD